MKRFHVHVAVQELAPSVAFYNQLFGQEATVLKEDYAKWQLEDPKVNFAISARGRTPGVDHLGIQVDSNIELETVSQRLRASGAPLVQEEQAVCCYSEGDKSWSRDPSGIAWESFHTTGESTVYGDKGGEVPTQPTDRKTLSLSAPMAAPMAAPTADSGACCGPADSTPTPTPSSEAGSSPASTCGPAPKDSSGGSCC